MGASTLGKNLYFTEARSYCGHHGLIVSPSDCENQIISFKSWPKNIAKLGILVQTKSYVLPNHISYVDSSFFSEGIKLFHRQQSQVLLKLFYKWEN